jgi:conjugal transfer pilus assembly protein TraK
MAGALSAYANAQTIVQADMPAVPDYIVKSENNPSAKPLSVLNVPTEQGNNEPDKQVDTSQETVSGASEDVPGADSPEDEISDAELAKRAMFTPKKGDMEDVETELREKEAELASDPAKVGPCADATKICTITVSPGRLEMLQLSSQHANRVITPFKDPEYAPKLDDSKASISISGSSLYIQPAENERIVMYVREKGTEQPVLQLGVLGARVIPRQIALEMEYGDDYLPSSSINQGLTDLAALPVFQEIREQFTDLAQLNVPDGFTVSNKGEPIGHFCQNRAGVVFDYQSGQTLTGSGYDIFVVRANNNSQSPVQLDETWCASSRVLAVAFWPEILVEPGEASEVYIAARRPAKPGRAKRHSLIGG